MTLDDSLDGDDDATYWPGYVDALTNIVLNLLFMVGVFAVGVFAVSLESSMHRQRSAHRAEAELAAAESARRTASAAQTSVEPVRRASAERKPAPPAAAAPLARMSTAPVTTPPENSTTIVRLPPPVEVQADKSPEHGVQMKFADSRGNPLAQVIFPGDRFSLVAAEESRLANWVREQQAGGVRSFMLFTSVDESDAQDRRAGYLRVMAARSTLMGAGVPASAISTRMFRGEQRELAGNRQITIIPNPRDN
jgi:hypothetical protein